MAQAQAQAAAQQQLAAAAAAQQAQSSGGGKQMGQTTAGDLIEIDDWLVEFANLFREVSGVDADR